MLPNKDKECFIIITKEYKTKSFPERDYGEPWGPSRAYTKRIEFLKTITYTNIDSWKSAIASLERSNRDYYAGKVTPATIDLSITID